MNQSNSQRHLLGDGNGHRHPIQRLRDIAEGCCTVCCQPADELFRRGEDRACADCFTFLDVMQFLEKLEQAKESGSDAGRLFSMVVDRLLERSGFVPEYDFSEHVATVRQRARQ